MFGRCEGHYNDVGWQASCCWHVWCKLYTRDTNSTNYHREHAVWGDVKVITMIPDGKLYTRENLNSIYAKAPDNGGTLVQGIVIYYSYIITKCQLLSIKECKVAHV
jgi:hypothetical protein